MGFPWLGGAGVDRAPELRRGCRGRAAGSAGADLGFSNLPAGGCLLPGTLAWTFSSESHPKGCVYVEDGESGGVPSWSVLWA